MLLALTSAFVLVALALVRAASVAVVHCMREQEVVALNGQDHK
jgi:hypothetical protein